MARTPRKTSKVNRNGWLATFADMVTLIMIFFVLLHAISSLDQEKYRMMVQSFGAAPKASDQSQQGQTRMGQASAEGAEGGSAGGEALTIQDMDQLYEYLKQYIEDKQLSASVQLEKGEHLVFVRFMSTLFFEADRATLKPGGKEILADVGQALYSAEHLVKYVRIDGHTAESAAGDKSVDDRMLSTDRANAVLKYFEQGYITEPGKLLAMGYGRYRPVAPNDSEENRAKNRRVEILIAEEDPLQDELDSLSQELNGALNKEIKEE